MSNSMWWDLEEILSYNALFNFIVGSRGCGKTYGFKKWAVKDFLKNGNQFIYVRRFKTEMTKKAKETFFDAVKVEFPNHDFKGLPDGTYYIDGKLAGQTRYLSSAKSEELPKVNKICFDEFVTNDEVHHNYLKDEVTFFCELYETIARMRPVKVFFFGNAITWANPYFTFFKIFKPTNKKQIALCQDGQVLIQITNNDDYVKAKEETPFGKLMKGTRYGNYAVHNDFYLDSSIGIAKRTSNAQYMLAFKINDSYLGLWYDLHTGLSYLSNKYAVGAGRVYALTNADHDYNTVLLKVRPRPAWLEHMVKQYRNGALFCENEMIRRQMLDILSIVGV